MRETGRRLTTGAGTHYAEQTVTPDRRGASVGQPDASSAVVPRTGPRPLRSLDRWADDLLVSFDGQTGTTLAPGESVDVRRADYRVCLIRLGGDGFFTRMRQKLHWGDLSDREVKR